MTGRPPLTYSTVIVTGGMIHMTIEAKEETLGFQTEVKQLLHLMIHSLYSHPEVFLRELVSNASDAADKLRFATLHDSKLMEEDPELAIRITTDKEASLLTIEDNGIGMNRDEVIENLGTIARSGTAEFLQKLTGDQKKDSHLIGQFGVGFYSAFIVADKVIVETRKAGETGGVYWESEGTGEFIVKNTDNVQRGTKITLHLKKEHINFTDGWHLRSVVRKYSDHISLPVMMLKETHEAEDDKEQEKSQVIEWETINTAKALWTCSKSELKDEDYKEFYKHLSPDMSEPLKWSHNKVEGKLDYTSLLYIPSKAPFDMYNPEMQRGLKLYIQRVYIMDDAKQFLPMYLRFVKGVLDSNDLPLNISRELLQKNAQVNSLKSVITKRVLDMLDKMVKKEPENYQKFWEAFGQVMKEGPAEDFANREQAASLLRFSSTHTGEKTQNISLDAYIERMKPEQEKIYYLCAQSHSAVANSPHLEVFRKKGIEVLLMSDRIDEWLMSHMHEFKEKQFEDISKGTLDLGKLADTEDKEKKETVSKEKEALIKRIKETLKGRVEEVRVTDRLTESPACLVTGQHDLGEQMRQMLKAAGQEVPESHPIMEINPSHPLILRLEKEDSEHFDDLTRILFEQAQLANGKLPEDSGEYVQRMNKLLMELLSD